LATPQGTVAQWTQASDKRLADGRDTPPFCPLSMYSDLGTAARPCGVHSLVVPGS
jgi:hypothetical protein